MKLHLDKPWMNNTILREDRQSALKADDTNLCEQLQSFIQHEIRYAKRTLAHQVDSEFQMDSKSAWANLKSLLKPNGYRAECSVNTNLFDTFFARLESDSAIVPDLPHVDPDVELLSGSDGVQCV